MSLVPFKIDFQLLGVGEVRKQAIRNALTASGFDRKPGRWRLQLIGRDQDPEWELRVSGPAVETTEYLDSLAIRTNPAYVADVVLRLAGDPNSD